MELKSIDFGQLYIFTIINLQAKLGGAHQVFYIIHNSHFNIYDVETSFKIIIPY